MPPIPPIIHQLAALLAATEQTGLQPVEVSLAPAPLAVPPYIQVLPNRCFANAAQVVLCGAAERYVLGLAWTDDLVVPIEHAWVQLACGAHYDPTYAAHLPGLPFRYLAVATIDHGELERLTTAPPRYYPPQIHDVVRARLRGRCGVSAAHLG